MDLVIGWVRFMPGARDEFMSLATDYVTATRAVPGVLFCEVTARPGNGDEAFLAFGYRDPEAHAALVDSPHEAKLLEDLDRLAVEGTFDNFVADASRRDVVRFPRADS